VSARSILRSLGESVFGLAVFFILCGILTVFIFGAAWASSKLLPIFSVLTWIGVALTVAVFLPLMIPKATRGFSAIALLIVSYIFGATLWMEGLLLTLSIWGGLAAIIGIMLAGIGVIPMAMIATLINGMWGPFLELLILTIATFGARIAALSILGIE
jgi:hypothetical protein